MFNRSLFSSSTGQWNTDPEVVTDLSTVFHWDLDVCASGPNICDIFFDKVANGLKQTWNGLCWMNPPYGRSIGKWVAKAFWEVFRPKRQAQAVVCLLPARTDTQWWQRNIRHASHVTMIEGRLKFGTREYWALKTILNAVKDSTNPKKNKNGWIDLPAVEKWSAAPFPSAFVVFGYISKPQALKLSSYGWTPYSDVL